MHTRPFGRHHELYDAVNVRVRVGRQVESDEQYDGEASQIAQMLVDAANDAGGKDNVSVIFVAGAEFIGTASRIMSDARARHSITRLRYADQAWRAWLTRVTWLVAGMILGALFWVLLVERRFTP